LKDLNHKGIDRSVHSIMHGLKGTKPVIRQFNKTQLKGFDQHEYLQIKE